MAALSSAVLLFKSSVGFLHDGCGGLVVFLMCSTEKSLVLPRDPKTHVFWAYSSFPLRHTEDITSLSPETLISIPVKAVAAAAESDPSGPASAVVCAAPTVLSYTAHPTARIPPPGSVLQLSSLKPLGLWFWKLGGITYSASFSDRKCIPC